jgi:osmotically-inducible protein OsmY
MMARTQIKSDAQIQQDVIRELKWDSRVEETDVGVEVDDGVVTLTGSVSSYAKRMAAEEAAHRVAGVLDVANDIQVRIAGVGTRNDTEIAQAIRLALEWDAHIPGERIQTTVSAGWVALDGSVDFWNQRRETERLVLRQSGVRGVTNKILIKGPLVDPAAIRESIEQALERRAEREARDIHVEVHDGTVTLTGTVQSWREKRAAIGAISHAPGVRHVEDHLKISPYF